MPSNRQFSAKAEGSSYAPTFNTETICGLAESLPQAAAVPGSNRPPSLAVRITEDLAEGLDGALGGDN